MLGERLRPDAESVILRASGAQFAYAGNQLEHQSRDASLDLVLSALVPKLEEIAEGRHQDRAQHKRHGHRRQPQVVLEEHSQVEHRGQAAENRGHTNPGKGRTNRVDAAGAVGQVTRGEVTEKGQRKI